VVDGKPSREVAREQAPLAAALEDVEDSVENLTKIVGPVASMFFGGRHVRFFLVNHPAL
jgi:hypothetical protein